MLESIFKAVLCMSALGSILALILLIFRPLTKKIFGRRWNYYIWLTVVVVMLVPLSVNLNTKDDHLPLNGEKLITQEVESLSVNEITLPANNQVIINYTSDEFSVFEILSYLWIICSSAIFTVSLIQYWLFIVTIRKKVVKEDKSNKISVKYTDLIFSPLTVGLFKKTILMPQNHDKEAVEKYVLKRLYIS